LLDPTSILLLEVSALLSKRELDEKLAEELALQVSSPPSGVSEGGSSWKQEVLPLFFKSFDLPLF